MYENISFNSIVFMVNNSLGAASTTGAVTSNTSYGYTSNKSYNFVIYSRNIGASSLSLKYLTSTQVVDVFNMTVSAHATANSQYSYSARYTIGVQSFTKDYSESTNSVRYHTSHLTDFTGTKRLMMPFAGSLSPGQYWLATGVTTGTTTNAASASNASKMAVMQHSFWGNSHGFVALGPFGSNTNSSVHMIDGWGSFSTTGAAGTTASVDLSAISSQASYWQPVFQLCRIT